MAGGGAYETPASGPLPSVPQSAPNLVAFDPKAVVPSQSVYLQRNDFLLFFMQSNVALPSARINYRWLTPQGEIKEGEFDWSLLGNGSLFTLQIYEGWLLSFAAQVTSGVIAGQWTFLQVFIARPTSSAISFIKHGLIWQGYIPQLTSNGWPGTPPKEITDGAGTIRSIVGAVPAAGADISELVTANRRWLLLSMRANLTTSAAAGNRNVTVLFDDGVNIYYQSPAFLNQTASVTTIYALGTTPGTAAPLSGGLILQVPLPVAMKQSYHMKTSTAGLLAGDQWTAPVYTVLEWGMWDS